MIDINAIRNLNFKLNIGKGGKYGEGGDAGSIFIFTEKITGSGEITAEGGFRNKGWRGGQIKTIAGENKFTGKFSVKEGDSYGT